MTKRQKVHPILDLTELQRGDRFEDLVGWAVALPSAASCLTVDKKRPRLHTALRRLPSHRALTTAARQINHSRLINYHGESWLELRSHRATRQQARQADRQADRQTDRESGRKSQKGRHAQNPKKADLHTCS